MADTVHTGALFPPLADWSVLTVACTRAQYSASTIARAVEDCDAHLLNLNVTSFEGKGAGGALPVVIDLRVNGRNSEGVCRSLERYGYTVLEAASSDGTRPGEEAMAALVRYLNT